MLKEWKGNQQQGIKRTIKNLWLHETNTFSWMNQLSTRIKMSNNWQAPS